MTQTDFWPDGVYDNQATGRREVWKDGRLCRYAMRNCCGDPAEGAALVFAESAKEARRLAFDTLRDWFDAEWIDTRVRRLRKHRDYLMGLYDGKHAVCDDPDSCDVCGTWGAPHDATGCEHCRDDCDGIAMPPNTRNQPAEPR